MNTLLYIVCLCLSLCLVWRINEFINRFRNVCSAYAAVVCCGRLFTGPDFPANYVHVPHARQQHLQQLIGKARLQNIEEFTKAILHFRGPSFILHGISGGQKHMKIPWTPMGFHMKYFLESSWNTTGLHGVFIC